jgi:hypothetical protein
VFSKVFLHVVVICVSISVQVFDQTHMHILHMNVMHAIHFKTSHQTFMIRKRFMIQ